MESLKNGIIPNVYLLDSKENYSFDIDYKENQITDEIKNSTSSEDIQKCLESGIFPKVYESYKISVEIIIKVNENFVRDREANTVTCTMGYILKQKAIV